MGGSFPTLINSVDRQEKKKKKEKQKRRKKIVGRKIKKKKKRKRRFSRCFDGRSSIVIELKLVHTMRATRGYQNPNFSSKLQGLGVFSYTYFLFA